MRPKRGETLSKRGRNETRRRTTALDERTGKSAQETREARFFILIFYSPSLSRQLDCNSPILSGHRTRANERTLQIYQRRKRENSRTRRETSRKSARRGARGEKEDGKRARCFSISVSLLD